MKGTISVNPMFNSYWISKPHIYCYNPLIVWDGHRLYFMNSQTFIKWQSKSIINATYSHQYRVILVMCDDSRVYVLSQSLEVITKITWQSKYSVAFQLIESFNVFLMIGVGEVEVLRMDIISNVKNTKFLSSMKFNISKVQHIQCDQRTKLKWNKGYGYQDSILYVWSLQDINFYSLPNLAITSPIRNLTRKENPITFVYYNSTYKYSITGTINGQIRVWRLPINHLVHDSTQYLLINTYNYHSKAVQSIIRGSDERMIISSAQDMTVCLWSLETFELLRVYNFLGDYSQIYLQSYQSAYAVKDGYLGLLGFGKVMDFITEINSQVIFYDKHTASWEVSEQSAIESIQLTLGSNIGFQVEREWLGKKDLNKTELQYIYPPLKAKGIQQILACPYSRNRYYLLVESGQIFRLRMESNSGKIEKLYNIEKVQDKQQYPLNQTATLIKFLKLNPPTFDSEIIENIQKKVTTSLKETNKFITIGCNKGTIIFVHTDNFERIHTRITYHRQPIRQIQSMHLPSTQTTYLASLCQEHSLKIVRFHHTQMPSCIMTINCNSKVELLRGFHDRLGIVLQKGIFEIFQCNQINQFYCLKNHLSTNHEDTILCMDHDGKNKLVLTAGNDNVIKIWSYYKVLIYEILLDDGLKLAIWVDNLEILVSHNLKILCIKKIGLELGENEVEAINQQFINSQHHDLLTLQEFLQEIEYIPQSYTKSINRVQYTPKHTTQKLQNKNQLFKIHKRQLHKRRSRISKSSHTTVEEEKKGLITDNDLDAMRKHVEQLRNIKKRVNASILPKIGKPQDNLFDNFMRDKLIKKKVLTRRDITLNRIIMKNIVKDHFGNDQDILSNLKLDF